MEKDLPSLWVYYIWVRDSKSAHILLQDIDDFDGFNNSDDEEKIEILDEDEDTSKEILPQKNLANIDEADELDEEMKQFQEAYEQVQLEGKQLRDEFENNTKKVIDARAQNATPKILNQSQSSKISLKGQLVSGQPVILQEENIEMP